MPARRRPVLSLLPALLMGPLLGMLPATLRAAACDANRPWAPVIELYTSQGCSSCPPADAWLGSLDAAALKRQVVPLAFHVDYWDHLGWRDPFAQAAHSDRQRRLSRAEGGSVVYTPQVRVAGEDFRQWRSPDAVHRALARRIPASAGAVALSAEIGGGTLHAGASGELASDSVGYLAVYERHLDSQIAAGENAGRHLMHDYVVRRWIGPLQPDAAGRVMVRQDIALEPGWKAAELGVALVQADAASGAARLAASMPACVPGATPGR
jgi:hypothetical protein